MLIIITIMIRVLIENHEKVFDSKETKNVIYDNILVLLGDVEEKRLT